jgi:hypothetical protein
MLGKWFFDDSVFELSNKFSRWPSAAVVVTRRRSVQAPRESTAEANSRRW